MRKKVTIEDAPRRKRRSTVTAKAVAIEREPGLMLRVLLHSPKDTVASAVAFAASVAIAINALFLQTGHHPAPMFGARFPDQSSMTAAIPLSHAAVSAPAAIDPIDPQPMTTVPTPVARPAPTPAQEATPVAAPTPPVQAAALRPPASIPARHDDPLADLINSGRRISAVQRVLTEYGYGQLRTTGIVDSHTQVAIRKFEADRKHPQTGKISDWLYAEIAKLTGKPIN